MSKKRKRKKVVRRKIISEKSFYQKLRLMFMRCPIKTKMIEKELLYQIKKGEIGNGRATQRD